MRGKLEQIKARHRRFARDEGGQVVLLTALLALVLVALPATLINLGQAIADKVQLQSAADAATLSATTWMARGSNLLQGFNGLHWDFNVFVADLIISTCLEADAEIAATKDPIEAAAIWWRTYRWVGREEDFQKSTARAIEGVQSTIQNLTPYLGFFYANEIAKKNGADKLDLSGFPVLGPVFRDLQKLIKPVQDVADIHTWTLDPSAAWPPSALAFAHKKSAPSNFSTPYYMEWWNPFDICIEFARTPSWHDNYWVSDNVDKTVTFIVSKSTRQAFMLNQLLNKSGRNDNLIGCAYALAGSKLTGDDLYAAGQKDTTYICLPNSCISINPPVFGIPFRWVTGSYGGKFKSELTAVTAFGQSGSTFLIYH